MADALALETLRPEHAPEMFAGLADPAAYAFLPAEPPASVDQLRERCARLALGRSADGSEVWLNWAIRLHDGAQLAGYTQATVAAVIADIGHHIFPAIWHRGFGTLAVRLTIRELVARNDVSAVRALVDTRNVFSNALLRGLGFRLVRTKVEADRFKWESSDENEFILDRLR